MLGGNKSLLFNIEELIAIAGPVRLVLFYDAGQVQPGPELVGPSPFTPLGAFYGNTLVPGKNFNLQDFKTSTGAEIRFFMPVLNVPFRLIFAYQPAARRRAGQHAATAESVPVQVCRRVDLLGRITVAPAT